jgi:beta-galactosidase
VRVRIRADRLWRAVLACSVVAVPAGAQARPGVTTSATAAKPSARVRYTASLDLDWRFLKGDAPGAEVPAFDDGGWRRVDVPHDWSIEGPFDEKNPTRRGGGYLPSGVSWYRKRFSVPAAHAARRFSVELDGVMAGSDVWINRVHLGKRPNGYVSLRYDLTDHLRPNQSNVLAVRTDTSIQPASRWYTGQGIYRHVRLVATDAVHIEPWGVFVTTPEVTAQRAIVRVQTTVVNESSAARRAAPRTTILDADGRSVATSVATPQVIAPGQSRVYEQDIPVANPRLWDFDTPHRYRAVSELVADKTVLDDDDTPFGIREARFEAASAFWLNGRNLKLKGVCLHHDGGAFGAAVPLGVWQRRLEILKEVGVNAIRTAHNPPAPEFLDLTDRMGFLVMDETFDAWTIAKPNAEQGYHRDFAEWWERDTRDTIRRDRNHPSVVIWSAGNEIHDIWNAELAVRLFVPMRDLIHKEDPSRPVTLGVLRPNLGHIYDNGFADLMDVVGQNYRENELIAAHVQKPERKVLGTENGHGRDVWLALRDNPFYAGQFLWSGVDYLGEADWPSVTHGAGVIDRTGGFRPRTYERQSWWSDKPMVHATRRVAPPAVQPTDPGYGPAQRAVDTLFSDWTPREAEPHEESVEVYSNCDEVELLLNGRSLGSKPLSPDAAARAWKIPYEPGTLRAVGRNKGQVAATHELRSAGPGKKLVLAADRPGLTADRDDVLYVTASVVDENGVENPWADDLIGFDLSGPGAIAAVDSADLKSHEPFQARERRAVRGRCVAILRAMAAGKLTLRATAAGLSSATLTVDARDR